MSGGSLNYFYSYLQEHVGDFGDKELDALVADLAELFHEREWYLSSDTGIGSWNEARDTFKEKWFTEHGRQERIEQYLDEFKREIMDAFSTKHQYCNTCKHWEIEEDNPYYGRCDLEKRCLYHRCESCKKYEAKENDHDGT